jgi:hypothetical protein
VTTSYLARIMLVALMMCAAIPVSGLSQSGDKLRDIIDVTTAPRATMAEREIAAEQGQDFVVGDAIGVAYFTSEPDGLRLVATVKSSEGSPVRFVATLAPDQTATVSVPGKVGDAVTEVKFVRRGERVVVKAPAPAGD